MDPLRASLDNIADGAQPAIVQQCEARAQLDARQPTARAELSAAVGSRSGNPAAPRLGYYSEPTEAPACVPLDPEGRAGEDASDLRHRPATCAEMRNHVGSGHRRAEEVARSRRHGVYGGVARRDIPIGI